LYVAQNPIVFTRVVVETGEVVRPGSGDREPTIQVHRVDEHTFVLRRNKTVDHEAPFRSCMDTVTTSPGTSSATRDEAAPTR